MCDTKNHHHARNQALENAQADLKKAQKQLKVVQEESKQSAQKAKEQVAQKEKAASAEIAALKEQLERTLGEPKLSTPVKTAPETPTSAAPSPAHVEALAPSTPAPAPSAVATMQFEGDIASLKLQLQAKVTEEEECGNRIQSSKRKMLDSPKAKKKVLNDQLTKDREVMTEIRVQIKLLQDAIAAVPVEDSAPIEDPALARVYLHHSPSDAACIPKGPDISSYESPLGD